MHEVCIRKERPDMTLEERWMDAALQEALAALDEGEEPVGAVVLDPEGGVIFSRARNQTRALNDPTALAEMLALTGLRQDAGDELAGFDYSDPERPVRPENAAREALSSLKAAAQLTLITTREPDWMCCGAVLHFPEIRRVVFGAPHSKRLNAQPPSALLIEAGLEVSGGILERRCMELLRKHQTRKSS